MKGRKFFRCPDCDKASVYMKLGSNNDDGWCCRTRGCDFWAYSGGSDSVDVFNRTRLRCSNAGHPEDWRLREVDWD